MKNKSKKIFGFEFWKIVDWVLIVLVVLNFIGFGIDIHNTLFYGGSDLRIRTVGTRVLTQGLDPYAFHVDKNTPDIFIDPGDFPGSSVTRLSVTPTLLAIFVPMANLPYSYVRFFWFVAQWILFLSTILILASCTKISQKRKLIFLFGLIIGITNIWRVHVETGQIYILYAFLLALAYKIQKVQGVSGFVIGFATTLRPTIGVFIPSALVLRKYNFILGSLTGMFLGFILPLFLRFDIWSNYFLAMSKYGNVQLKYPNLTSRINENFQSKILENMHSIGRVRLFTGINTSLQSVILDLFHLNVTFVVFFFVIIFVTGLFMLFLFINFKKIKFPVYFLGTSILFILVELLLPFPRLLYSDVVFIVPVALLILNSNLQWLLKSKINYLLIPAVQINFVFTYIVILYLLISYLVMNKFKVNSSEHLR